MWGGNVLEVDRGLYDIVYALKINELFTLKELILHDVNFI